MKLLHITPQINLDAGLPKVLSLRTNYLITKWNYSITVLTQNKGNIEPFFEFNSEINFVDINLETNIFKKIRLYRQAIKSQIAHNTPDFIIVTDFGLKGFLTPFLISTNIPIIFEAHGSLFNENHKQKNTVINGFFRYLKYKFRAACAKKFDHFIALSSHSLAEWNVDNASVIPNPSWFTANSSAPLTAHKAIVVARHSHEKGLDKIISIWQKIIKTNPDWVLEIYGKSSIDCNIGQIIADKNLQKNIKLYEPVKNIQEKYTQASMYLMASSSEGYPMVLIEAMAAGLPCIAYDCPIGPRAIIVNNYNGLLIENDNETAFVEAIEHLIADKKFRQNLGKNAYLDSKKNDLETIMATWNNFYCNYATCYGSTGNKNQF